MADTRKDIRNKNSREQHRGAFLRGWSDAVRHKRLYTTVHDRKTNANMGNLFGWIYGQQSRDFRLETWYHYRAAQAKVNAASKRPSTKPGDSSK